ncbi:nucleotidyltransferase [Bacillus massilinigeriensis]|uniref:nucleotidyltransferase n=1 Tax=Bacillus massilionigeriensis TaxID=1805475 RepID=UPI00096B227E|nr:nucleotidyltransferase [Bacillus massilionigeriensis]
MKAVGVIVEYNPFHNGHAFHLEQSKEISKSDIVIAVMSGNFLQRGEPALVSKWTRTEMALAAGIDIIFELPYQFATQKAETFANGAVSILAAAGCDSLCFGSEAGSINPFIQTLSFLEEKNEEYQMQMKKFMNMGYSYPRAASQAFHELGPNEDILDLSKPNNILGYHYLKSVHSQKLPLNVLTVSRKNADYHDEHFSSETIASATSIRKALFEDKNEMNHIRKLVPNSTFERLVQYKKEIGAFHQWEDYWDLFKYQLISLSAAELKEIYEVEEGIENRVLSAGLKATSFTDFMNLLKTKRYTWTRLQRMCVHILTNTKKEEMRIAEENPSYLRLLGMSDKGRKYLKGKREQLSLPLISKLSSFQKDTIQLDIKASRIYALGAKGDAKQLLLEKEYSQPPIYYQAH